MNYKIMIVIIFFIILISIQYSLNKIIYELKDIKKSIISKKFRDE